MGRTHRRRKKPDLADVAVPIAVLIALFFSKHLLGLVLTAIGVFLIPIAIFVWLRYTKANSAVTILPVIFSTTGAKAWSIDLLKSLDWKRFEELCLWYFQETGYHAAMASFGPDGGVDITLYESADPTKV